MYACMQSSFVTTCLVYTCTADVGILVISTLCNDSVDSEMHESSNHYAVSKSL